MIDRIAWRRAFVVLLLLGAATFMYFSYQHTGPVTGRSLSFVGLQHTPAEPGEASIVEMREVPAAATHEVAPAAIGPQQAVTPSVRVEPIASGFFDSYRLDRERAQSLQLEQLRELLSTRAGSDTAGMEEELVRLLQRMEREVQLESLLRARGLEEALVVLAEQGVIVVLSDEITQSEAARIGDMVHRVAGVSLEHITISDGVAYR